MTLCGGRGHVSGGGPGPGDREKGNRFQWTSGLSGIFYILSCEVSCVYLSTGDREKGNRFQWTSGPSVSLPFSIFCLVKNLVSVYRCPSVCLQLIQWRETGFYSSRHFYCL